MRLQNAPRDGDTWTGENARLVWFAKKASQHSGSGLYAFFLEAAPAARSMRKPIRTCTWYSVNRLF
jgi:hypothetical protein